MWRALKNDHTLHFYIRERDLEKEESNLWYIAPAPVIGEIPAAEELQRELKKNELQRKLEKNTASNHMGKIYDALSA